MAYQAQERNMADKTDESDRRFMFVMGEFPNPCQTFILREMVCLYEKGVRFEVLAEKRATHPSIDPVIASLQQETYYLPRKAGIALGAFGYLLRHPLRTAKLLFWAMRFPHRTWFHRARFLGTLMSAITMAPRISKLNIARFHAHFAGFQTELAMCLSKLLGIPYGVTWHAYGIWKDKNILKEKLAGADIIITCTRYNAEHLKQLAPHRENSIYMVNHGIEVAALRPKPLKVQETPIVLAVGRLIPKKGFQHLLDAAALLKAEGMVFRVIIAGDGPERDYLMQRTKALKLERVVTFAGALPNHEIINLLTDAYVLVTPSVKDEHGDIDGIPNVLIEAMASERPVIGSDLSGIPEVVNEQTGRLVPAGSASDLALAIRSLLMDKALAKRCGKAGRSVVESSFDIDKNVDKQLEILQRAAEMSEVTAGGESAAGRTAFASGWFQKKRYATIERRDS